MTKSQYTNAQRSHNTMSKCYKKSKTGTEGDKGKEQNETRKQTNSLTWGEPSK